MMLRDVFKSVIDASSVVGIQMRPYDTDRDYAAPPWDGENPPAAAHVIDLTSSSSPNWLFFYPSRDACRYDYCRICGVLEIRETIQTNSGIDDLPPALAQRVRRVASHWNNKANEARGVLQDVDDAEDEHRSIL